jgi:hypothetical protein
MAYNPWLDPWTGGPKPVPYGDPNMMMDVGAQAQYPGVPAPVQPPSPWNNIVNFSNQNWRPYDFAPTDEWRLGFRNDLAAGDPTALNEFDMMMSDFGLSFMNPLDAQNAMRNLNLAGEGFNYDTSNVGLNPVMTAGTSYGDIDKLYDDPAKWDAILPTFNSYIEGLLGPISGEMVGDASANDPYEAMMNAVNEFAATAQSGGNNRYADRAMQEDLYGEAGFANTFASLADPTNYLGASVGTRFGAPGRPPVSAGYGNNPYDRYFV